MTFYDVALAESPLLYMAFQNSANPQQSVGSLTPATTSSTNWPSVPVAGYDSTSSAARFNGTTNYLQHTLNNAILSSNTTFSVAVWIKRNAPTTWANIYHREVTSNKFALRIDAPATTYANKVTLAWNGTGGTRTLVGKDVSDNLWHFVVVTHDSSTSTAKLYVDNVLYDTQSTSGLSCTFATNTSSRVGAYGTGTNNENFSGDIDDVLLYGKVLSPTQIQSFYVAGGGSVQTNKTVQAPAMILSLATVTPSVYSPVNVKSTVSGAMALSLATVVPAVTTQTNLVLTGTQDHDSNRQTATKDNAALTIGYDSSIAAQSGALYFGFDTFSLPTGYRIKTAKARFYVNDGGGPTITMQRITNTWVEGTNPVTTPTGAVTASLGLGWNEIALSTSMINTINSAKAFNGVALGYVSGNGYAAILTSESGTNKPQAVFELEPIPATNITVTAPVMTLSLATVAPAKITTTRNVRVQAPAMALSLSTIAPKINVSGNVNLTAPVMTMSIVFPGGKSNNPDYHAFATPMEMWITTPNPSVKLEYPIVSKVQGAMELTLSTNPATINLTTNRLVKVNNAMTLKLDFVGKYIKEADRYFKIIPSTIDNDDVWLQMEESAGPKALDSIYDTANNSFKNDAVYKGNPIFKVEGPQGRRGVRFDGVDDYLQMGAYNANGKYLYEQSSGTDNELYPTMSITVEFSIKTTDLNGVIFAGTGGQSSRNARLSQTATDAPYNDGTELRMVDGYIEVWVSGRRQARVSSVMLADGQWHHVVFSHPTESEMLGQFPYTSAAKPAFIMIDGKPALVRYSTFSKAGYGAQWVPYSFMARAIPQATGANYGYPVSVSDFLGGDLRDVIVRLNYAVTQTTAQKLYYEWSDAVIVQPDPMVMNLRTVAPARARGNAKKMLVLYGLPSYVDKKLNSTGFAGPQPVYNYFSEMGGFYVQNYGDPRSTDTGILSWESQAHPYYNIFNSIVYPQVKTFPMGEFTCYPVSILGEAGTTSAPGTVKTENLDYGGGANWIDDETGLARFINLQTDLSSDPTDYDAITVVNYPWAYPEAAKRPVPGSNDWVSLGPVTPYTQIHPRMGLTDAQWTTARDRFRDSVMEAAYAGCSLFIPEFWAAQHLGFIQGYDNHGLGGFLTTSADYSTAGPNKAAKDLDVVHGMDYGDNQLGVTYDYFSYPQALRYRRIVALEPGLTDLASWDIVARIHFYYYDNFRSGQGTAFDVRPPTPLQQGDLTEIRTWTNGYNSASYQNNEIERKTFMSARPDGIAGKVIAREQEFVYGPNGIRIDNPYKNNAVTIASERGTIVRGRPIGGRAFMEFMDTDTMREDILINDPDYKGDEGTAASSTWDFDERRQKSITITLTQQILAINSRGEWVQKNLQQQYNSFSNGKFMEIPFMSMNRRGLHWIAQTTALPVGDVRVYTNPIELTLTTPNPKFSRTRNVTIPVTGVMRMDLEVRQPAKYSDGNVRAKALPMVLGIEMRGLGKHVKVDGAMVLNLTMPQNTRGYGDGKKITVYLENNREITVFLKEDN